MILVILINTNYFMTYLDC